MYTIHIHKSAEKSFKKAPKHIQQKALIFLSHLMDNGLKDVPYPLDTLKGTYKKYKYLEAKIHADYRIIFRQENEAFFIRYAGTHNGLGTG